MRTPVLLISAGPSREFFDAVRFLSNSASGTLGIEIARFAVENGWRVHLALGPVAAEIPEGVQLHPFVSARELDAIAERLWPEVDAFVATAAVCDYSPQEKVSGKRKKSEGEWQVKLIANPDVLFNRSREKEDRVLVGFALETGDAEAEARRKAVHKRLDLVVSNAPENLGAAAGDFAWVEPDAETCQLRGISKKDLSRRLVDFIGGLLAQRRRCDTRIEEI